jgi:hypothetical protein
LPLIAFNHPQGLGIAALGIAAVVIWRLIEWKRSALWWLIGSTIVINALFLAFYPRPAIIESYRTQGWLNAWYGFNILDYTSPAGERMLQIVSALGLINLAATLFILRRNHVVAWLSTTPFLVLIIPCISIPFANVLSLHGDAINIIAFQRLLFAIPPWLALAFMGSRFLEARNPNIRSTAVFATSLSLTAILVLPGSRPQYNRAWHTLTLTPKDLQMTDTLALPQSPQISPYNAPKFITTYQTGAVLQAIGVSNTIYAYRMIGWPAVGFAANAIAAVAATENRGAFAYIPSFQNLSTNTSLAGLLSTHWSTQEVAVDLSAGAELNLAAINAGAVKIPISNATLYELRKTTPESR